MKIKPKENIRKDAQAIFDMIKHKFAELDIPESVAKRCTDFVEDILDDYKRNYSNKKKK